MTLIHKIPCNALIENARINWPTQLFLRRVGGNTIVNVGRKITGGLWVGGTYTCTTTS